ncbi:MAG: putative colanic acid biosynthesis acetyltransferase [Leptothrix sp. (in: b-proteobacteria)]
MPTDTVFFDVPAAAADAAHEVQEVGGVQTRLPSSTLGTSRTSSFSAVPSARSAYDGPSTSMRNRLGRVLWGLVRLLLIRPSPRPCHAWRAAVLRLCGARLGPRCHIYPGARIWAPWNLDCADAVGIADGAVIYNPSLVRLGSHAIVSQDAYLCGASHDHNDPAFPMVNRPITLGAYAWVAARAVVGPGVTLGDGAVLGLASVAMRDLAPWTVYVGAPARPVNPRTPHVAS